MKVDFLKLCGYIYINIERGYIYRMWKCFPLVKPCGCFSWPCLMNIFLIAIKPWGCHMHVCLISWWFWCFWATHWKSLHFTIAAWSWSNWNNTKAAFEVFGMDYVPTQPDPDNVLLESWEVWTKFGYRSLWRVKHYQSGWMDWCLTNVGHGFHFFLSTLYNTCFHVA